MYQYEAEVVRVVDGDSVWLKVDVGFRMTFTDNFRLLGIDTPELRTRDPEVKAAAYAAKARLEQLLPVGSTVLINTDRPGKYGRWLAVIYLNDDDHTEVNATLLSEGHAKVYGS